MGRQSGWFEIMPPRRRHTFEVNKRTAREALADDWRKILGESNMPGTESRRELEGAEGGGEMTDTERVRELLKPLMELAAKVSPELWDIRDRNQNQVEGRENMLPHDWYALRDALNGLDTFEINARKIGR